MYDYLENNNILFDHQFGFRKKHNTKYFLINILNEIHKNHDINNYCCCLFIDLTKAFNSIDYKILVH